MSREIKADTDLESVTNDLALIAKVKRALTEKKDEYTRPIKGYLADVTAVFTQMLSVLEDADTINRSKVRDYRAEQSKRALEAEEINRDAKELARRQAEFSGTGEISVDTSKVTAAPVIAKISTEMGTAAFTKNRTWELEDWDKVPKEYKLLDSVRIGKVVRAGGSIPGIKVIVEENLRINTK